MRRPGSEILEPDGAVAAASQLAKGDTNRIIKLAGPRDELCVTTDNLAKPVEQISERDHYSVSVTRL
jgi:hypothetical protein